MKITKQTIYTADDGKIFDTEKACLEHEAAEALKEDHTHYFSVIHSPDTTEGRGFYGLTYLKTTFRPNDHCQNEFVHDYCFRTFGRPIQFVQGVAPIAGWILRKTDKEEWHAAIAGKKSIKVGDYSYEAKTIELKMGERETGLYDAALDQK